ncbi:uncharacterized protein TNIN_201951, partial [Trichonephila inaurata madagascariensis]
MFVLFQAVKTLGIKIMLQKLTEDLGQGLESLKTFCAVMSLPNPVEQKSYDVINNKLSLVMKEVAEESMKRAAVEENSSLSDNLLTASGDGTWKTRGHSSLIGVCTVIGAETEIDIYQNLFLVRNH